MLFGVIVVLFPPVVASDLNVAIPDIIPLVIVPVPSVIISDKLVNVFVILDVEPLIVNPVLVICEKLVLDASCE